MTYNDTKPTDWDPQVRPIVAELNSVFPTVGWGTYGGHEPTKGRATDGMIPGYTTARGIALGNSVAEYAKAHAVRLNIWYVIWRRRIWSRTRPSAGWLPYRPTAAAIKKSPASAYHDNHVHVSVYQAQATPFGVVWMDRLVAGVKDSESVRILQRALRITPPSGDYDSPLNGAIMAAGGLSLSSVAKWLTAAKLHATITTEDSGVPAPVPPVDTTPPLPAEYPVPTSGEVYLDKLDPGVTGSDSVAYLQVWLAKVLGENLRRTGTYDQATEAMVKAYQRDVLGDSPDNADGDMGKLQTIALAKAAGAAVKIFTSSATGGQVWPELTAPPVVKPPPSTTKPNGRTLHLKDWSGSPAGRTLIQGVKWDPLSGSYFIHQADDVSGQAEQTVVIRRHSADGTYRGYSTLPGAGHGSSIGHEPVSSTVSRIWLGHKARGAGFITYTIGQAEAPWTSVPLPNGDITVDADADLVVVRVGTLYRAYRMNAARAGKAVKVWEVRIPNWQNRFQGHLLAGGRLYIHRDVATKGPSLLRCYDPATGKKLREWDTNPWGDEAEGAMVKDGWVWSVSRVGGNTPSRTVVCTPIERV